MHLLLPELFEKVSQAKNEAERIQLLQSHKNGATLKYVLALNFDPQYEFDLPKGEPPYKRSPHPTNMAETNFYAESKRLYILIKNHPRRPKNIKRMQVENIFIQMLEGINGIEADMLIALKDKQLQKKYKGLTESLVRRAFPEILPEKQAETG
jgi:hypothetical protein